MVSDGAEHEQPTPFPVSQPNAVTPIAQVRLPPECGENRQSPFGRFEASRSMNERPVFGSAQATLNVWNWV